MLFELSDGHLLMSTPEYDGTGPEDILAEFLAFVMFWLTSGVPRLESADRGDEERRGGEIPDGGLVLDIWAE